MIDTKKPSTSAIIITIIAVALLAILAYYISSSSKNLSAPPASLNPIDPDGKFSDYRVPAANVYVLNGLLAGTSREDLTLRTRERALTLKKPDRVRYFAIINNNTRSSIAETQLLQNEQAQLTVTVDESTNEIAAISILVRR